MTSPKTKIIGIILAGGKGTRMDSKDKNKTALDFNGRPLLTYGMDLFRHDNTQLLVVKGALGESVAKVVREYDPQIWLATQRYRLGTGHAALVADRFLVKKGVKPKIVLVGYGDHMMFYHQKTVEKLIKAIENKGAVVSVVVAEVPDPKGLGRVVRNETGAVEKIVEEKNATEVEKEIRQVNAALYAFDYDFFHEYLTKLKRNQVTNEYYLTDLIEMAVHDGKIVWPVIVPFEEMGIGINTKEELAKSKDLFKQTH